MKQRLIEDLESVHARIAWIDNLEVESLLHGDCEFDGPLTKERMVARRRREAILRELKAHVARHRC